MYTDIYHVSILNKNIPNSLKLLQITNKQISTYHFKYLEQIDIYHVSISNKNIKFKIITNKQILTYHFKYLVHIDI